MLGGLTPVGITFVAIVLFAMTVGVTTVVYYSILAPRLARKRQLRADRAAYYANSPTSSNDVYSPYLDKNATGGLISPQLAEEKNMFAEVFVKEDDSREMSLSPPLPAYAADKRGRFSTATQDGIWWVV
ncbi:hypothetical protein BC835DRAFT_1411145 [Cytidiella melzeri]|nr:hypothetical protein BC835DRAFT_1411145 [Cytidiella melzeri]